MQDWMLPRITDYWDLRVEAIERLSRTLEAAQETDWRSQMEAIGAAVTRHAGALSDKDLTTAGYFMVEDLYKSVAQMSQFDNWHLNYLHASAGALLDCLSGRGYTIHYFVDNTYTRLESPAIAFPAWFRAAGIVYLCPQQLAACEFKKDRPVEEWPSLVSEYIVDARLVANDIAEECHQAGRHFIFLDFDLDLGEASIVQKHIDEPGVIHMLRADAPVQGSRCFLKAPPGPNTRATGASVDKASQ
jgi:hypothetical protein